jgi:hypothetical protein
VHDAEDGHAAGPAVRRARIPTPVEVLEGVGLAVDAGLGAGGVGADVGVLYPGWSGISCVSCGGFRLEDNACAVRGEGWSERVEEGTDKEGNG